MKASQILVAFAAIFLFSSLYAASKESPEKHIEGLVIDKMGKPIYGASVVVKGTNFRTVTNASGYFSMEMPDGYFTIDISAYTFLDTQSQLDTRREQQVKIMLKEVPLSAMDEMSKVLKYFFLHQSLD